MDGQIIAMLGVFSMWAIPFTAWAVTLSRKVSQTNAWFDPNSAVGQSVGTVPAQLKSLREHEGDVRTWQPQVDAHQARQDERLKDLEGR